VKMRPPFRRELCSRPTYDRDYKSLLVRPGFSCTRMPRYGMAMNVQVHTLGNKQRLFSVVP